MHTISVNVTSLIITHWFRLGVTRWDEESLRSPVVSRTRTVLNRRLSPRPRAPAGLPITRAGRRRRLPGADATDFTLTSVTPRLVTSEIAVASRAFITCPREKCWLLFSHFSHPVCNCLLRRVRWVRFQGAPHVFVSRSRSVHAVASFVPLNVNRNRWIDGRMMIALAVG